MHELDLAVVSKRTILPVFLDGAIPPQEYQFRANRIVEAVELARWPLNLKYLESLQAIRSQLSSLTAPKDVELSLKNEIATETNRLLASL